LVLDECWEGTNVVVEQLKQWPEGIPPVDVVVVPRPKKEGLAAAKNFGLKHCTGDWITYLDGDDTWDATKLEKQAAFAEANPEYDFIGTLAVDVFDDGRTQESCFAPGQYQEHEQIKERLSTENVMCHGSLMIRKTCLEDLKGYSTSPGVLGKEDWDLWRRAIFAHGFRFYNIPERLYRYSMETSIDR
jgi:glycosyltransferase involved in cell wall biosynthesis